MKGVCVRSAEQFEAAMCLAAAGVNNCVIARQLGVPRPTVQDWRRRPQIRSRRPSGSGCGVVHDFSALPPTSYCYVLGLYLHDGCVSRNRRVWRLRNTLDKKYPDIIDRCRGHRHADVWPARIYRAQPKGCVVVSPVLEALAVSASSTLPRQKALEADSAGALAGGARQTSHGRIHSRPDR
jgi:hypothetical protein